MRVLIEALGILGSCAVVYGAYLAWAPLGYIVGGLIMLGASAAMTRRDAGRDLK